MSNQPPVGPDGADDPDGAGGVNDSQGDEIPPMRSQSALNLPPVVPWPEPVDGKVLLDELKYWLHYFIVLPRWSAEILALWIVHTYAVWLRQIATYIGIESPVRRCGKTTLMTLLSELVERPEPASNISAPYLYRAIEELRPTLLIDEAETFLKGNAPLRGILNSGYTQKMGYVLRITNEPLEDDTSPRPSPLGGEGSRRRGRGSRLARYSCFGPKAIAQIGHLPETLADRCLVIRLQRKLESEERVKIRDLDKAVMERLRRQCARFVLDHRAEIARARPELPRSLNDRAADLSEPLIVLADLAGGDWPALARAAAVGLAARAEENDPLTSLLLDIRALFLRAGGGRLFTRTLLEGLNSLPDRPWATLRRGSKINDAWLSKQLQPHDVRPRTIRIGRAVGRGYVEADFVEVFKRYLPARLVEAAPASGVMEQETQDNGPKAVPLNPELGSSNAGGEASDEKPPSSTPEPESEGPTGEDAAAA